MSELEATLLWQMRALGLPDPEREYHFHPVRKWRFDYAWPSMRLAVEVDGWGHQKLNRYTGDIEKMNAAALAGWRVLHVTGAMVRDGRGCALIEEAIQEMRREHES